MSAPTFHQPTSPPSRRRRVIGFSIASAVTGLVSLAFLASGGALLYLDSEKDGDGYYTTSTERFHTDSHAIASGPLDLDFDGAGALLDETDFGRVRLHAESNGGEPVFVGIARSDDVDRYLRGTAHTTVTEIDGGPPPGGGAPAATPPGASALRGSRGRGRGGRAPAPLGPAQAAV